MSRVPLYLFTDTFPYGSGEKTFIIPEIYELEKNFDVTIISSASIEDKRDIQMTSVLSSKIKVIHYPLGNVEKWEVFRYIVPFFLYPGTFRELRAIFKGKKRILCRIKKSLYFFASADKFRRWINRKRIIRQKEKIICYSYWYNYRVLGLVMNKARYPYMKILTRAHGYDLYNERVESSRRQSYKTVMDKKVDKVVFISQDGYNYYLDHFACKKIEPGKYYICKLGVERQEKVLPEKKRENFLLVSCANLVPVKRIELIISGLKVLEDIHIRWVHFGMGREYENLLELAHGNLDSKKNIIYEFKGYMDNAQILDYYKTEVPDCFILTSYSEGSPVAMQEALSFGIPIIGTNVGGIPDMINGNGVLLSSSPSIEEVADAIRNIYSADRSSRNQMRNKSYQIWRDNFDREKIFRSL